MKGNRERENRFGGGEVGEAGRSRQKRNYCWGVLYARRIYFQEIKQNNQANKQTKPRSSKEPEFCVIALGAQTCACQHIDNFKIAKTRLAFNIYRLEIKANVF